MDINGLQKMSADMIGDIDKKTGRNHDDELTMLHITEELGEIARVLYNEKTGRAPVEKPALAEELADTIMLLSHLASKKGVNLEEAIEAKRKKLEKRFGL